MMDEPVEPRVFLGGPLAEISREDLELYSSGDLQERIARLEGEISRTRAALDKKRNGRAAADAFFKFAGGRG